nr:helix-turn-helix domain-containing protein [Sphingomonas changbaiensis]
MNQPIRSPKQLGSLIRQARLQRSMTQKDLADLIGTYQKTISQIENGNPGAKLETMFSILAALDLDLELVSRRKSRPDLGDIF